MTPISRQEAELAYDRIRTYLIFSACWFLLVAAVVAISGMNGWEIYLGAILLIEGVAAPLCLRYFRRDLEQRVRAAEDAPGEIGRMADVA